MAGLNMSIGGFGGVQSGPRPSWGNATTGPQSVTQAAFGPGVTNPAPTVGSALHPSDPVGLAFWVGAASILALVAIRHSLPA
jgi:hypothetical protein